MKMLVFCLLRIVLGCLSSTDLFQIVSSEKVADKIDGRPLALQDEDTPKGHAQDAHGGQYMCGRRTQRKSWEEPSINGTLSSKVSHIPTQAKPETPTHTAKEYPTLGNDYLLAVTGQYYNYKGTLIHVSCATDTTVNVFAPYVNRTETYHISSGTQMIPLDDRLMNGKNTLAKKGVHVTADTPIAIYVIENYYDHQLAAMEGYFALPISVLSTEYVVVTDTSAFHTMCQFVIAALENKTIVNVTFKTTGKINIADTIYSSGDVFSLEMSTLDTFQVQHGNDLTGTFIQSNKPIAVFSGCLCGNGPVAGGACQHEVEQIVPVSSLGQEYITLPLIGASAYRYRIIVPFNNTIVSIQGQNFTIESGTFLEQWDTKPIYIQASKPVMLIEYGQCTSTYEGCTNGSDPSMITIPAISKFSVNVTFGLHTNLTRNYIQYYLYVTVKTDVANKLMLDHKMLNLEVIYAVKTDIWGNYTILVTKIASGYHKLHYPDTSVRYGAVLYGTGQDSSIGFPLGYNTAPSKQWAGHSDPVIEPNVCFGKESTVDLTILFAAIGVLTSLLVISVLLNVHFIRKSRRIQIPPLENLQSANQVPPEDKAVTDENISPADNTRSMQEHLHLRFILPSDEQDGYLTPKISGMHHEYEYIESI